MLTNMDINLRQAKRVWNVEKNYYRAKKRLVSYPYSFIHSIF
jgi:hypothetical protein